MPIDKVKSIDEQSAHLREFLKERDFFNMSKIAARINYNRGNFTAYLEGHRELPHAFVKRLQEELKRYGYIK